MLFISASQYFLVQLIAAKSFMPAYSLKYNTISDLGNTTCAIFNGRMICSPHHALMNVSFFILGLTMIIGSILFYNEFENLMSNRVGFSLFAIGGFGVLLVALFPENTIPTLHGIGALLPFLFGNIGLVLISYRLKVPKLLRLYTLFSGIIALIALFFYGSGHYASLGEGGIERVVAYPQTLWMIIIGMYFFIISKRRGLKHP